MSDETKYMSWKEALERQEEIYQRLKAEIEAGLQAVAESDVQYIWIVSQYEYRAFSTLAGVFSSVELAKARVENIVRGSGKWRSEPVEWQGSDEHCATKQNKHGTRWQIVRAEIDANKIISI